MKLTLTALRKEGRIDLRAGEAIAASRTEVRGTLPAPYEIDVFSAVL